MFSELLGENVGKGEMEKEGHVIRSWKRRYFELRGDSRPPINPAPPMDQVLAKLMPDDIEEGEEIVVCVWNLVYYRLYCDAAVQSARTEKEVRGTLTVGRVEYEPGFRELKAFDAVTNTVYILRADSVGEARRWAAVLKAAARGLSPEEVASAWHRTSSLSMEAPKSPTKRHNRSAALSTVRAFRARRKFALDASRQNSGSDVLAARLGHKIRGGRRPSQHDDLYARIWLHALSGIPRLADVFVEFFLYTDNDEDEFVEEKEDENISTITKQRQRSSTSKVSKAHRVEVARWVPAEAFTFRLDRNAQTAKIIVQVRCRLSDARRTTGMIAGATVGAGVGATVGAGIGAVPGAIIGACVGADESLDNSAMQQTQSICDGILSIDLTAEKAELANDPDKIEEMRKRRFVKLYDPKTNAPAVERNKNKVFEAGQINTQRFTRTRRLSGGGEIAAVLDVQILDGSQTVVLEDYVWEHERKAAGLFLKNLKAHRKDKSHDWSHEHLHSSDPAHFASLDYSYHGSSFKQVAPRVPPGFIIRQDWHLGTADAATDVDGWRYAKHFPKLASRDVSQKLIAELVSRGGQGGAGGQLWWDEKVTGGLNSFQANVRRRVWRRELIYIDPAEEEVPDSAPTDAEICVDPEIVTPSRENSTIRHDSTPSFSEKDFSVPPVQVLSPTSFSEEHHEDTSPISEEEAIVDTAQPNAQVEDAAPIQKDPALDISPFQHSVLNQLFKQDEHLFENSDEATEDEASDDDATSVSKKNIMEDDDEKILKVTSLLDKQIDFFDDDDDDDDASSASASAA
mmetsp:Transcript_16373/g.21390  ORF Transcript_16373/g.21390 Transcript_16373/m.21390 type:complete len:798 (-) Transcript_16373:123-2516(-)